MRIAQLAPTYERVPPSGYGGTELVVHLLTEALVRLGHRVTLFASGDSITSARLRSITPAAARYGADGGTEHPEWLNLANAQACFRAAAGGEFDIVHNHAGPEGLVLAATSDTPVLTTNHLAWAPEAQSIWDAYPWFHNGVSAAAASSYPARGRVRPILHGVDVGAIPWADEGDGYLLFLGRFSPEKGPDVAVEVARRTGRRLVLAGKVDGAHATYIAERLEPAIDGDRIRRMGEMDLESKRRLVAGADALLFPISWDEPFGLVMIEALAAGTPVIAFRRGSVPEVVDHGMTGFVVDGIDGMAAAVSRLGEIDRLACRATAERRFDVGRMAEDYERHYRAIEAGKPMAWPDDASMGPPALEGAARVDGGLAIEAGRTADPAGTA